MKISEIKVSYQSKIKLAYAPRVTCSKEAYKTLLANWKLGELELRESFKILLLNRANFVKGIYTISEGGLSGTVVDPKLVFSVALKTLSSTIILGHNHPTGVVKPSSEDERITERLVKGGKLLEIQVVDHIIIGKEGYYSFADSGLI